MNFGESFYFVRLWKTKRCVWPKGVEPSFLSGTLHSPYMFFPSGTLCLFFLSNLLLLLSNKRIFFFFLFLPNHRYVLWFNSFTTQPQHQSLSMNPDQQKKFETQEHLQPICMREEPEKKKWSSKPETLLVISICWLEDVQESRDKGQEG